MDWLWQGIIITVAGGLSLAALLTLIKSAYRQSKRYNKQISHAEIKLIEDKIISIRKSYRSASAFYREFDDATWMKKAPELYQIPKKDLKVLKTRWVKDADFTQSWDHTNIELMKLQVVKKYLTKNDIKKLIDKPIKDIYGNDQAAGRLEFIKSIQNRYPRKISRYVAQLIKENDEEGNK